MKGTKLLRHKSKTTPRVRETGGKNMILSFFVLLLLFLRKIKGKKEKKNKKLSAVLT